LVTTPATGDYDIGDYDNYDDADANTAAASTTSSNTHSGSVTNDARRTSDVRAADAESQSTVSLSPTKKTVLPAANKTQAFPEYTKQTTTSSEWSCHAVSAKCVLEFRFVFPASLVVKK